MKIYYAHCLALYDTKQEKRDILTLESLGFTVINPNTSETQAACDRIKMWATFANQIAHRYVDPSAEVMKYFERFAKECDAIAFRALPDGRIPGGVYTEIQMFKKEGKPVVELPSNILSRQMTIEQSREYLGEVGYR